VTARAACDQLQRARIDTRIAPPEIPGCQPMAGTLMERARTSTRDPSTFHDPRHAAIIQGQTEQRLQDGAPRAPGVPLEVAREQRVQR
jgi:hypothetical protein